MKNMVKLVTLLLLVSLVVPFSFGCKPKEEVKKKLKVALVATQKFGDKGTMDDMALGLQNAKNDFDVETLAIEALVPGEYEEQLRGLANEGYDLIMVTFFSMIEVVKKVAPDYPNTKFSIIFGLDDLKIKNVRTVLFKIWEPYFVAGAIAAKLTQTGKLAHIAGSDDPILNANYNAFLDGARMIRKDITLERIVAGTFEDPAKGKELAYMAYDSGVDIIVTDCAATTLGVIEAAKEKGKFIIGDSVDHSPKAPSNVIVSTLCNFGQAVYNEVKDLKIGKWEGGLKEASFINRGVGISQMDSFELNGPPDLAKKIPEVKEMAKNLIEKIEKGEIIVERKPEIKKP